ncbi:BlaI/MecI/CopY family transcriptional regulator [Allosaccharopolyspora coralli]|uniref:BlaI/MecI/CopY family transcriptional regulator n=1 Tax=Allosaccharopolyspora coralli TaxID=2665642 RepID=A0A5Q3QA49_9PSEU|nr:BlaI/MecI/CopY family transcriptional regulator [Allosaccharopolyspora coralli]QGK70236.1 BlaI/MecI/CopY family transcriptional regulator [Allosaccharopolyspora coralli]
MRGFGELETAIMEHLWSRGTSSTVREVVEELREERNPAYTTVMTVMDILHRKGWLDRERDGRAWRYEPTVSREEHAARLMREALSEGQNMKAVLMHFLADGTPEEVRSLQEVLRSLSTKGSSR